MLKRLGQQIVIIFIECVTLLWAVGFFIALVWPLWGLALSVWFESYVWIAICSLVAFLGIIGSDIKTEIEEEETADGLVRKKKVILKTRFNAQGYIFYEVKKFYSKTT